MNNQQQCVGCGVILQSLHPEQVGYRPAHKEHEVSWCQRCFRIRHYNEMREVEQDAEVYRQQLATVGEQNALIVQVIDLFDFSGSVIPDLRHYIGQNPLLIIGSKMDLFPYSTNGDRLKEWVVRACQKEGLFPKAVVLGSAKTGFHVDEVMAALEYHRQGRDIYLVGTANVGKSTWINRMLQEAKGVTGEITTSPYPGTTLDFIHIPLDDGSYLIDTPGLLKHDRLSERLQPTELQRVIPATMIKPRVYQLNPRQTLFIGGLVRFDFLRGERQSFVCHISNRLLVHRTKLENADAFAVKHIGGYLTPPNDPQRLSERVSYSFRLSANRNEDITISGLGFITSGKKKAEVRVTVPAGIEVFVRPSIISK